MTVDTQQTITPDQNDPLVNRTIGNYVVRHKIGEGGMGSVYFAEHPSIGKRVALKVLHAEFASQADIVSRFFNEAKAVNDIGHPNIVDIVDFGTMPPIKPNDPPLVYFFMELIAGMSLSELIRQQAPFAIDRALGIGYQIADALAASHRVGIVHRDLKPENVMLIARGRERDFVKLLDFGIAKLTGSAASTHRTRTGMVIGTPQYMSPEQCEGRGNIDLRTDIYALGVVLYQMMTGKVPFVGEGFGEVLVQQMAMPPLAPSVLNPQITPHVELVILKALEKRPDNRYQKMEEMMTAMQNPVEFVEANGGSLGFLTSPMLRDPAASGAGAAIAMLTPGMQQRATVPTTLGGSTGQVVPTPGKSKTGLVIGLGVLLAGAGVTAGLVLRGGGDKASASEPEATPTGKPSEPAPPAETKPSEAKPAESKPAETKPAETTPRPVESKTVKVEIDSTPSGAAITVGGVSKGTTPFTGELDRGTTPVEVTLTLAGHEPITKKIEPNAPVALVLPLEKKKAKPRPNPNTNTDTTTGTDDTKNPFERKKKKD